MHGTRDLAVLGTGVIGLSTALLALERGWSVRLLSPVRPDRTTSARAAASFKPHLLALDDVPADTLARSWRRFAEIEATSGPEAGVRRHTHWEAGSRPLTDEPFLSVVEDLRHHTAPEVPGGYAYGRSYTTFFIDMSVYLRWLTEQVAAAGATFTWTEAPLDAADVAALPEATVANCTGLGARELVGDTRLHAVRGQAALVEAHPDRDWSISADGFYLYPRRDGTVVGGTVEWDAEAEAADPTVIDLLLRAARRVLPQADTVPVIRTYAGLRPYRTGSVRVEAEDLFGKRVVHHYGHGGGGVTASWGTAALAVDLLEQG